MELHFSTSVYCFAEVLGMLTLRHLWPLFTVGFGEVVVCGLRAYNCSLPASLQTYSTEVPKGLSRNGWGNLRLMSDFSCVGKCGLGWV